MFERILLELFGGMLLWMPTLVMFGFERGTQLFRKQHWVQEVIKYILYGVASIFIGLVVVSVDIIDELSLYTPEFSNYSKMFFHILPIYAISIPLVIGFSIFNTLVLTDPKFVSYVRRRITKVPDDKRDDETYEEYITSLGKKYISIWHKTNGQQTTGEFIEAKENEENIEFQLGNASQYDSKGNLISQGEILKVTLPLNETIVGFSRSDTPIPSGEPPEPFNQPKSRHGR